VKHRWLRKLSGVLVLAVASVVIGQASEPRTAGSVLRESSQPLADPEGLENYNLVTFKSVYFSAGKAGLGHNEEVSLNNLARWVSRMDQWVIELRGYADGPGSSQRHVELSRERAKAVARFLIEHGIPLQNIILLAQGEIEPTNPALNLGHQRVDIRIFMPPPAPSE
jgi:outer membrane protein OmpA-like peptidoglycan-associated protein